MPAPALRRRTLLAALLTLSAAPAMAASGGGKAGEVYVKVPGFAVEFWDAEGLFHTVNMELTAVFPLQVSLNKSIPQNIAQALSAMTWEDFSRGNPAATVKAVALDVVRKDPAGAACLEVLVIRLVMR